MNNEGDERHLLAIQQSSVKALKAVKSMKLPRRIVITNDSFNGIGRKIRLDAIRILEQLSEVYQQDLPYLMGVAMREHWFSLHASAEFIRLSMATGDMGDNDHTETLATPNGYGEIEGIAYTLYNHLANLNEGKERETFRDNTRFQTRLKLDDILNAAALNWFAMAASLLATGEVASALDWIGEAYDAHTLSHGNYMWNEGEKITKEETEQFAGNQARSTLARIAAQARHTENRAMKAQVFQWLDSQVKFKSNEAAATAITTKAAIAHVTARDWYKQWKKLQSASTP